jgi:UDP-3-O-[3-hydroxymyristoyl] glucosamine N-acyltransferase
MKFSLETVKDLLSSFGGKIVNEHHFKMPVGVDAISEAKETSLVFIDQNAKNKEQLIAKTKATTIICDHIPEDSAVYKNKCLIIVNHPKLFFAKLVNQQLNHFEPGIHPTAVIDPRAEIANTCYIGPHVCIGNAKIGENTYIHSNCTIYDSVEIGKNVVVDAGCVIGAAGFGFVRDDKTGEPTRFPQLGGVIIEDNVEIGANVCIDRGALQNTIIHKGVKIDDLSLIAHNVEIGEYTYIIGAMIGGSTKIGKRCWIASSKILNKITIGDNVTAGYGSVVLKSIPTGATYMGNPAVDALEYAKRQYKLKGMSHDE